VDGLPLPNKPGIAKAPAEFLENPAVNIPADIIAKSETIEDLGDDLAKYTKAWDEVKAAK